MSFSVNRRSDAAKIVNQGRADEWGLKSGGINLTYLL